MTPVIALVQAVDTMAGPELLDTSLTRSLLAFVAVAGLLACAVWGLGRLNGARRGTQAVSIESAVALGDKRSLVIVAVEGRRLLLGVAPGGVSLVTELQRPFDRALDASLHVDRTQ